ncbi:MAG TPA: isoprenylcysteine carboxylmethyltransferase family protein, partial [Alcanivorax sp.]|nr:isoprenylcysteine carboxylmethyltransferase family protein [Alcanivorax sp.]
LIAIAVLLTALLQLARARTTVMPHRAARTLITGGVFRLSRNPIYLAFALLHLACALSLGSPGMLLMLVAVLWVMHSHVIAAEEAFHAQRFGAQWQAYRQRVRRWL